MKPIRSLISLVMVVAASTAHAQDAETWAGAIDLSAAGAGALEFSVTFVPGDSPTAKISIPAQGVMGLDLTDVVYSDTRLEFTLAVAPPGVFTADRDGARATGTLSQGGGSFPIELEHQAEADSGPVRPQHPEPPFPYEVRDVTYETPGEGNTLAGTLTVPAGDGPHPAALLITGSGSQDRDETIFGHKPFWVIADYLSRRGIAVLRVDDRGVGGSNGVRPDLTSADFAEDVRAGVAWLRAQPEIDGSRVGLIGHSEGGLIAPMVAAEDPELAFIVLARRDGCRRPGDSEAAEPIACSPRQAPRRTRSRSSWSFRRPCGQRCLPTRTRRRSPATWTGCSTTNSTARV